MSNRYYQRYDIKPDYEGKGWWVIDTANRYCTVELHPTREKALRRAIQMDNPRKKVR
jgi:hypothetical protein